MRSTYKKAEAQGGSLAEAVQQLRAQAPQSAAVEHRLRIAGHEVLIRYGEPALADALGRATRVLTTVAHGTPPSLTIDCWTEPDAALRLPTTGPATGTVHVDDGCTVLNWDATAGPLFAYDRRRRHAWARFDSLEGLATWERAAPFRRLLHWWAADQSLQLVHAAAVGKATGGLLLVGRSGSGKSTTALACLEAGLGYAGDDYCLVASGDPSWVHGLYSSAKADARAASLLPGLSEALAGSPLTVGNKMVLFADDFRPDGLSRGFPLRGIVVPRLTRQASSHLSPLPPAAALRAMAPSTLLQMPGQRAEGLGRLAAVVRDVPAWELRLGEVPSTAAALIGELLESRQGHV